MDPKALIRCRGDKGHDASAITDALRRRSNLCCSKSNPEPMFAPVVTPFTKASIPFPSRRNDERRKEKANDQIENYPESPNSGRCFLKTSHALIDVYEGRGIFSYGRKPIRFVLLKDDPTSSEVDPTYQDPEGDILILEEILNMDPTGGHYGANYTEQENNLRFMIILAHLSTRMHDLSPVVTFVNVKEKLRNVMRCHKTPSKFAKSLTSGALILWGRFRLQEGTSTYSWLLTICQNGSKQKRSPPMMPELSANF
ncbi:hypothetical protein Tco_1017802 [Tanacetum coccineum]|uniref:Uncharacterized protein n=1 Tax=Tanacetum coccineum TaxID=301880 RepID=A0ABQ5FV41_9ASTR